MGGRDVPGMAARLHLALVGRWTGQQSQQAAVADPSYMGHMMWEHVPCPSPSNRPPLVCF